MIARPFALASTRSPRAAARGTRCTTARNPVRRPRLPRPAWSSTAACAPRWGWTPQHLTLWDGDALVAAAPGYLKANSHGEFVFDHAWAHAYAQHGLRLLPEVAGAPCPTRPSPGRACWRATTTRGARWPTAMARACARDGLSSAHVNFHRERRGRGVRRRLAGAHRRAVPLAQRRGLARLRRLPRRVGPQAPQEHPPGARQGARAPA